MWYLSLEVLPPNGLVFKTEAPIVRTSPQEEFSTPPLGGRTSRFHVK